ncbi:MULTISPECIES: type VII secretion protein EccE [Streptomyces]|uniref:Type VII secretion protein EccE n=1 Tax=Streptomyces solicathayae TaxID=3081768 RepID=A0ABZ0LQX7_9ACTN|nr:type VII secretion protein EccE [Streptomyces sp. HUAS YS2]WOX21757.1 type VII secretion protein EccE [Streptomyces sp. HUAS YS2]
MASVAQARSAGGTVPLAAAPSGALGGAAAAPSADPVRGSVALRPAVRAGHGGSFRLQQLVLIEVAAALLLAAWAVEPLLVVPAAVFAGVLVLLAVARRRRRALPEWLATVLALRARTRRAATAAVPAGTDPGLAPVVECDPALRTYAFGEHTGDCARDRRPVGLIGDGTFLTAVVRVESEGTALRPNPAAYALPVGPVLEALAADGIRLESAQIVQHTQPAPAPHLPDRSPAARNYASLHARTGAPAVRITWIALKLDPELCPEAVAARGGGLLGAQRCVVRAADRLASRLAGAQAGLRATVLSERELTAALATSTGADPRALAQPVQGRARAPRTRETARTWRCDDSLHTTYWVGRWPQLGGGRDAAAMPRLVALLTSLPATATTFSLTLSGADDRREATVTGHVRVTGRSDAQLVTVRRELERAARGVRVGLVRLDREQVPGVLATLPLGGAR